MDLNVRECSCCGLLLEKKKFSKTQWKKDPAAAKSKCISCASIASEPSVQEVPVTSSAIQKNQPTRVCAHCEKSFPKDEYRASQWKKGIGKSLCLICAAYCRSSLDMRRTCVDCSLSLERTKFSIHQWENSDGVSRCESCFSKWCRKEERRMSAIQGNNNVHVEPDGTQYCSAHRREVCKVCMLHFALLNDMTRASSRLQREPTQEEAEDILKDYVRLDQGLILCAMSHMSFCPRNRTLKKCTCKKFSYCSEVKI